jgi:hypothetical protein
VRASTGAFGRVKLITERSPSEKGQELMTSYPNLIIRISPKSEVGYAVELDIAGRQYTGVTLSPDILPWTGGGDSEAGARRLSAWFFDDPALSSHWAAIAGQHPQRNIRLRLPDDDPALAALP